MACRDASVSPPYFAVVFELLSHPDPNYCHFAVSRLPMLFRLIGTLFLMAGIKHSRELLDGLRKYLKQGNIDEECAEIIKAEIKKREDG